MSLGSLTVEQPRGTRSRRPLPAACGHTWSQTIGGSSPRTQLNVLRSSISHLPDSAKAHPIRLPLGPGVAFSCCLGAGLEDSSFLWRHRLTEENTSTPAATRVRRFTTGLHRADGDLLTRPAHRRCPTSSICTDGSTPIVYVCRSEQPLHAGRAACRLLAPDMRTHAG